ncbi:MAG: YigZ family protein [Coprococcus sp.]|nr:YigZ family protein [Coprococcus sp.]
MIEAYNTIVNSGQDEIVEKKSRFIGYAVPVKSEEEAYALIESIKKKHYDARHHCFAFAIGNENTLYRFSDDGEPQGTAGKPILEVITGQNVVDICIVVTRYFGGTLLGTGGLVRAYTEAAKLALDDAGIKTMELVKVVKITTSYNDSGKIQYLLNSNNIHVENTEYTSVVVFEAYIPVNSYGYMEKQIIEATSARAVIEQMGDKFC